MELRNVHIFRMTHIENIPHVLKYGITHKDSPNANPKFIAIGDVSLINTRNAKIVRVDNNNYHSSDEQTIILGDIPSDYLYAFVCYDGNAYKRLVDMGIEKDRIHEHPNADF